MLQSNLTLVLFSSFFKDLRLELLPMFRQARKTDKTANHSCTCLTQRCNFLILNGIKKNLGSARPQAVSRSLYTGTREKLQATRVTRELVV